MKGELTPDQRYGYAALPPFGGVVHRFYGERLLDYQRTMREKGTDEIFWIDYTALPTWRQPTMDSSPPEYDLYLISHKLVEHKQSRTSFIPLLKELTGGQRIDINTQTAHAKGIEDGDAVWVESHNAVTGETRRVRTIANLTGTIRPDHQGWLSLRPWRMNIRHGRRPGMPSERPRADGIWQRRRGIGGRPVRRSPGRSIDRQA